MTLEIVFAFQTISGFSVSESNRCTADCGDSAMASQNIDGKNLHSKIFTLGPESLSAQSLDRTSDAF